MIFTSCFPPLFSQKKRWQASRAHADEIHRTGDTRPIGVTSVPPEDPNWDCQAGRPGQAARNHTVACLIVCLQKAGHKAITFDQLQEVTQGLGENPAQFLAGLKEALQKYTKCQHIAKPQQRY